MLIQVYDTIFEGNPSTYLLFLALFPTVVTLLLMFLVRICEANSVDDRKHLNAFSAIALTMAGYLMVIIILENIFTLASWAHIITLILLLLLLALPLAIAFKAEKLEAERLLLLSHTDPLEKTSLVDESEEINKVKANSGDNPLVEDLNLRQALSTSSFWFLFIAMICGMGSGLATINNISQVAESLGYTTTEKNSLVSLWSIWNF